MIILNEKGVDVFISKYNEKRVKAFWVNYNLYLWQKTDNGFTSTEGMYKDNVWGIAKIIPISNSGTWGLPIKYVKYFK